MKSFKTAIFLPFIIWCFVIPQHDIIAQKKEVTVTYEQLKEEKGFVFYAENTALIPYYIQFNFSELVNLMASEDIKTYIPTIFPGQKVEVLQLKVKEAGKSSKFNFNYLFTIGNTQVAPDLDHAYWLPYQHAKRVKVGQGYNGPGTHKGVNAIDFNLQIGDTVYATRDGVAFDLKEDSNVGGYDISFDKKGNYLSVYHSDGTYAKYVHLNKNGVLVKKGEKLKAGQPIAISGNTGYSSGPHLHLVIYHNDQFQNKSLAVKYLNRKEEAFIPTSGQAYYGYHTGKGAFSVEDETTFDLESYQKYRKPSKLNNEVKVDTEQYGDYVIVFSDNGYNKDFNGQLQVELQNMESTEPLPLDFRSPARSKIYLTTLRPVDPSQEYSYRLSIKVKNN